MSHIWNSEHVLSEIKTAVFWYIYRSVGVWKSSSVKPWRTEPYFWMIMKVLVSLYSLCLTTSLLCIVREIMVGSSLSRSKLDDSSCYFVIMSIAHLVCLSLCTTSIVRRNLSTRQYVPSPTLLNGCKWLLALEVCAAIQRANYSLVQSINCDTYFTLIFNQTLSLSIKNHLSYVKSSGRRT